MAQSLQHLFDHPTQGPLYQKAFLHLTEPERVISFQVPWEDDDGVLQVNRGWRVEYSSALGPYKGGLRFHPTVDEGVLKFLAFEQVFKNALTGLPLGGGKGGSDFDPKNKSKAEIKRFCQSFMIQLYRYLHPSTDVPAGDIGVGSQEIGFLMGQYKRLANRHGEGVLTGKSESIGGSFLRPEATGYGLVYIANLAIQAKNRAGTGGGGAGADRMGRDNNKDADEDTDNTSRNGLKDAICCVSGSGNVAQYTCRKLLDFGAKVVTVSDSNGVLYFEHGMTLDDWSVMVHAKNVDRLRLSQIANDVSGEYRPNTSPWQLLLLQRIDYAFPCATQNEINNESITRMIQNQGLKGLFEGANLPTQLAAQQLLAQHPNVIYIPGKAANAGGVGVSGFEMSQNAQKMTWHRDMVEEKLQDLMAEIYAQLVPTEEGGACVVSLKDGANQAGFVKVVNAMQDLGWI